MMKTTCSNWSKKRLRITALIRLALLAVLGGVCAQTSAQPLPDYALNNLTLEPLTNPSWTQAGSAAWDIAVTPDGTRMVIGCNGQLLDGCTANTQGAIYIYDYDPQTDNWVLNDAIKNCVFLGFGTRVAISDDGASIIVGINDGTQNNGGFYIYREIAGVWTEEFSPYVNGFLGNGVDLSSDGNTAIAVSPPQLGSYFEIYRRDANGVWSVELYREWNPFVTSYSGFCAIDGNWAAIAMIWPDQPSPYKIQLLEHTSSGWEHRQYLNPPTAFFGAGIAPGDIEIDGDRMILGQPANSVGGGYMQIYELNTGTNQWEMVFEENGVPFDGFATDVDILGDRAIVSRAGNNDDALVYERVNGAWQRTAELPSFDLDYGTCAAVMDRGFLVGGQNSYPPYAGWVVREFAAPTEVCSFTETFDGITEIPTSLYAFPRMCSLQYIDNGQLVLERLLGCNETGSVVLAFGDAIVGDFDVSVDWERFGNDLTGGGAWAVPTSLWVYRFDDRSYQMGLELYEKPLPFSYMRRVQSYDNINGPGDLSISDIGGIISGSFRIARVGTTWSSYYKLPGDSDWTLLRTATLTDAPVTIGLAQYGESYGNPVGIRLDDLSVTVENPNCDPGCNPADLVVPYGVLDFFDIIAFLDAFSAHDPVADFTNDGEFNFFDVAAFLDVFSAGCP